MNTRPVGPKTNRIVHKRTKEFPRLIFPRDVIFSALSYPAKARRIIADCFTFEATDGFQLLSLTNNALIGEYRRFIFELFPVEKEELANALLEEFSGKILVQAEVDGGDGKPMRKEYKVSLSSDFVRSKMEQLFGDDLVFKKMITCP